MKHTTILAVFLITSILSNPAVSKVPTVALSITGPGFELPLHLDSPEVTEAHVWMGNFADWQSGAQQEPTGDLPRYAVHFWVRTTPVQMKYVVDFVWDETHDKGYIYLPGRGDPRFYNNVYSILRENQDGKWFNASDTWGRALWTAINQSR